MLIWKVPESSDDLLPEAKISAGDLVRLITAADVFRQLGWINWNKLNVQCKVDTWVKKKQIATQNPNFLQTTTIAPTTTFNLCTCRLQCTGGATMAWAQIRETRIYVSYIFGETQRTILVGKIISKV